MTEKRRIEEAYRSMNEWVDRGSLDYDNPSEYAKIDDISRTDLVYRDIGERLYFIVMEYLMGKPIQNRNVRVSVRFDNNDKTPVTYDHGKLRKMALDAFDFDIERAAEDFSASVRANGNHAFTVTHDSVVLNHGMYTARATARDGYHTFTAEVIVTKPIELNVFLRNEPKSHDNKPFYKPNLPESTVTEAEDDREVFGMARRIASELAKSADAGDAEGVFRCFNGLRGVVNRLTP